MVVDPGPMEEAHLESLLKALSGLDTKAVVITHTHKDHTALARLLADRLKAELLGPKPHSFYRPLAEGEEHGLEKAADFDFVPDRELKDGERFLLGEKPVENIATPGHTANHMSFLFEDYLLSGDHVMDWSTTIIAPPDGHMGEYLASLEKLMALKDGLCYLPGHGQIIKDGKARAAALLSHRKAREAEILAFLREKGKLQSCDEVAAAIYHDVPQAARKAARLSALAHLEYLVEQGLANIKGGQFRAL